MNKFLIGLIIFGAGMLVGFMLAALIAASRDDYPEIDNVPEWQKNFMEDDRN